MALAGFASRSGGGEGTQQTAEILTETCLLSQNCFELGTDGGLGIFSSLSVKTAAADDVRTVAGARCHREKLPDTQGRGKSEHLYGL